jgi:pyridoxal biosynthesis lyase PdxS
MAKSYITIKTTEIDTVDFSQVIENREPLRYSLDDSEFIVKWIFGAPHIPESVEAVPEADRSLILTHLQARTLMQTPEWTSPE